MQGFSFFRGIDQLPGGSASFQGQQGFPQALTNFHVHWQISMGIGRTSRGIGRLPGAARRPPEILANFQVLWQTSRSAADFPRYMALWANCKRMCSKICQQDSVATHGLLIDPCSYMKPHVGGAGLSLRDKHRYRYSEVSNGRHP